VPWDLQEEAAVDGAAVVRFALRDTPETRAEWPHSFALVLSVSLRARELSLALEVHNSGTDRFTFAAALHTYLAVSHIADVRLHGLRGMAFVDQADNGRTGRETREHLVIAREIDRIYAAPAGALILDAAGCSLRIAAENFPEVVVWNPWREKCATLTDMPPRGFERMLCVEAALVRSPVTLEPAARWSGRQTLVDRA
jgi:glucose-6-phosphate 1-epimerase